MSNLSVTIIAGQLDRFSPELHHRNSALRARRGDRAWHGLAVAGRMHMQYAPYGAVRLVEIHKREALVPPLSSGVPSLPLTFYLKSCVEIDVSPLPRQH